MEEAMEEGWEVCLIVVPMGTIIKDRMEADTHVMNPALMVTCILMVMDIVTVTI